MKILLVTEFFPTGKDLRFTGGVEARTFFLAKYLALKHQVFVLASRDKASPSQEKLNNITIYRVGPRQNYSATAGNVINRIKYVRRAINFGQSLDIDIVDGSNFIAHLIAKEIANNQKTPLVFWYPDLWIGSWIKNIGIFGIFGEMLERLNLARGASAYIAISNSTAQKLKKYIKDKIHIIACGVDFKEFKSSSKKFLKPTIICISRLVPYKRIEDLIWAFALLLKKGLDLNLIIVGRGPREKKLKNICQMLKISTKVSFFQNLPRKELIEKIKSSHLSCLPSQVEGFGISTVESAAAGVPYVISDIPVFKEITKNGKGGLIFKLGDVKDLAGKIEKLLTDRSLYQKKAKEAQNLAKNYQWQEIAKKTEEVYRQLIS